ESGARPSSSGQQRDRPCRLANESLGARGSNVVSAPKPIRPTCPVCAEPRAAGTKYPARYCGDGACRQSAHKRKHRLIRRFGVRHTGKATPPETIAAMGMRAAWKPGKWFSKQWAATAAGRAGIHLDEEQLATLLRELVEDVLDETVTAEGDRLFTFPSPR